MAILGFDNYLCEACKYFDSDGADGNHPSCRKQSGGLGRDKAVRLGEECPYSYEFGVPSCYPVNREYNERRAHEIKAKLDEMDECHKSEVAELRELIWDISQAARILCEAWEGSCSKEAEGMSLYAVCPIGEDSELCVYGQLLDRLRELEIKV